LYDFDNLRILECYSQSEGCKLQTGEPLNSKAVDSKEDQI